MDQRSRGRRLASTARFPERFPRASFFFPMRSGSFKRITALVRLVEILLNSILVWMCDERNTQTKTGRHGYLAAAGAVWRYRSPADAPTRRDGFPWRHVLLSRRHGPKGRLFRGDLAPLSRPLPHCRPKDHWLTLHSPRSAGTLGCCHSRAI